MAKRPQDDSSTSSRRTAMASGAALLGSTLLAGRIAQFTVLGDRRLMAEMRDRGAFTSGPLGVGMMDADKNRFTVYATLPLDGLWAMGAALSSGSVRYVVTHGPRLVRGKALVRDIRFEGNSLELADWV